MTAETRGSTRPDERRPLEKRLAAAGLPPLPRGLWLEIDLDALAGNVAAIRASLEPGVLMAGVVKADAYGHGLLPAARALVAAGVDRLCVATLDEAFALRAHLDVPVLVLFQVPASALLDAAVAGVEVVVASEEQLREVLPAVAGSRVPLRVHLEIDTGLRRAGVVPARAADVTRTLLRAPGIELVGAWSHLASAHDPAASSVQVRRFSEALAGIEAAGARGVLRHVSATGAVFAASAPQLDMVRIGLSLYGLLPDGFPVAEQMRSTVGALRPAMSLLARPLRVEDVQPGEAVGYGGRWRAERPSRVATLPVGYGDGWSYVSAGRTSALVRGRRVPLVGSVAMDAVAADVTDVPGVDPGDEFVLLGSQGDERITALDLARVRTTIPWEVVTAMAYRVPRVYDAGADVVCVRTLAGEMRQAGTGAE